MIALFELEDGPCIFCSSHPEMLAEALPHLTKCSLPLAQYCASSWIWKDIWDPNRPSNLIWHAFESNMSDATWMFSGPTTKAEASKNRIDSLAQYCLLLPGYAFQVSYDDIDVLQDQIWSASCFQAARLYASSMQAWHDMVYKFDLLS